MYDKPAATAVTAAEGQAGTQADHGAGRVLSPATGESMNCVLGAPAEGGSPTMQVDPRELGPFGRAVGFLLSQLGYAVTRRFRAELESFGLEPRHFGLMRGIEAARGLSQQALGESLHIPASSVVALLDNLEQKGLVRRGLDPSDRRVRLVELTDEGRRVLSRAIQVAIGIESALCLGFSAEQRDGLISTLQKVAGNIGLTLGVHPGTEEPETEGTATGP
jgi:DNA-binding MarR family transcriptional regulator